MMMLAQDFLILEEKGRNVGFVIDLIPECGEYEDVVLGQLGGQGGV